MISTGKSIWKKAKAVVHLVIIKGITFLEIGRLRKKQYNIS